MPKLQLKFRENSTAAKRRAVLNRARAAGASAARPLFPGETDPELAAMHIVEFDDPALAPRLRELLGAAEEVEYVEAETRRKPR